MHDCDKSSVSRADHLRRLVTTRMRGIGSSMVGYLLLPDCSNFLFFFIYIKYKVDRARGSNDVKL